MECLTPSAYGLDRGLERVLINIELVPRESTETAEHLEEDLTDLKLQRAQHANADRPCRWNHVAHARRT